MGNAYITNLASEFKPAFDLTATPILDQSTAVSSAAVAMLTTALADKGATQNVFWSLDGGDARVTFDGSDPVSTSNGHLFLENTSAVWSREMVQAARWIRETVDVTLRISEFNRV